MERRIFSFPLNFKGKNNVCATLNIPYTLKNGAGCCNRKPLILSALNDENGVPQVHVGMEVKNDGGRYRQDTLQYTIFYFSVGDIIPDDNLLVYLTSLQQGDSIKHLFYKNTGYTLNTVYTKQ